MFGVLTTGAEIAKNSADLGQLEKQTLFLCESKVFVIISGTIFHWKLQLGVQSVFPQLVAIQEVFFLVNLGKFAVCENLNYQISIKPCSSKSRCRYKHVNRVQISSKYYLIY